MPRVTSYKTQPQPVGYAPRLARNGLTLFRHKSKGSGFEVQYLPEFHTFPRSNLKRLGKQHSFTSSSALKCANEPSQMFSKGYRRWGSCSSEAIEDIEVYTEVGVTRSSDCTAFVPLFTFRISIPIRVSEAFDNFSTRNCFRNLKTFHGPFDGLRVSSSATLRLCHSGQTTRAKTLRQRAVSYTSDTVWAFGWYKKMKNEKAEK